MARKGRPRKPLAYHLIRGSYRRDRHGPLPVSATNGKEDPVLALLRADCELWRVVFECGYDFFRDLPELIDPRHETGRQRKCVETLFLDQVFAAWQRLGAVFMDGWEPHTNVTVPFAVIAFGDDPMHPHKATESLDTLRRRACDTTA